MTQKAEKASQGWGFPDLAKKAHYFVGVRSMCGMRMFMGELEDARHDHPDNCKVCAKKHAKLTK